MTTLIFIIGFLSGAGTLLAAAILVGLKQQKSDDKDLKKILKDVELMGSVKYRFAKANEITEAQLDLVSQAERPSASAAHSRHKNDIIRRLKQLEEEKIDLFRSILKDGVDPVLSVMIDGVQQTIKMSEAVMMHENNHEGPAPVVEKTETITPKNRTLKLVTETRSDNEPGDPAVP